MFFFFLSLSRSLDSLKCQVVMVKPSSGCVDKTADFSQHPCLQMKAGAEVMTNNQLMIQEVIPLTDLNPNELK